TERIPRRLYHKNRRSNRRSPSKSSTSCSSPDPRELTARATKPAEIIPHSCFRYERTTCGFIPHEHRAAELKEDALEESRLFQTFFEQNHLPISSIPHEPV